MIPSDRTHGRLAERQARRWATLWSSRSGPCSPSELLGSVGALLDEAHRELHESDLARVLLATRSVVAPLALGRSVPPLTERLAAVSPHSPGGRAYVRPIEALLRGAGTYSPGGRRRFAAEIAALVEEVAARPKGSAVPTG